MRYGLEGPQFKHSKGSLGHLSDIDRYPHVCLMLTSSGFALFSTSSALFEMVFAISDSSHESSFQECHHGVIKASDGMRKANS